ncbi:Asp-tRNA(Asn)/Glu-tRNA(Gln) amidotransferase subunit GatC [Campylobacter sp. FMV-PI01]|uniref:Aspartyl/glutamyl-tRNA(Asn/Gln) amidotransferase subunit C n=1 Tax=Campylobacter portucalensis TaxID=2608384 RepID=A0A6L5WHY6_9BACT|nr:Asp-tRNA(Asn)/Glu-tRNA(Gln) amidotransferase subunit GatC [Campylobacter portucalensis]MSN95625.1 Asp-tRNA(Asn)/Glu-tRNA(Gln) amidotransferase subunit GatC [Campylobacter portucalensis]
MQISDEILKKLEKLSAFKIPDEKREEIKSQLGEIVNFVEILNELNLDKNSATTNVFDKKTPLREDIPSQNREVIDIILKNAPKSENGFFVVPKIIE